MPRYEIVFRDEVECDSEEQCYDYLFEYLQRCIEYRNTSAFQFYKLKEETDDD